MEARASPRRRSRMAEMSAPETNALSPLPVTMSTVARAFRASSSARCSSATVSPSSALRTSGRLTVSVATRPPISSSRFR